MLSVSLIKAEEWPNLQAAFKEANFLHSVHWHNLHKTLGLETEALVIKRDKKIIGMVVLIVKDAKRGRYLEIAGGPLIDWSDPDIVKFTTETIIEVGKKYNAHFIRLRPQEEHGKMPIDLKEHGFKKAPMHLHAEHTSIVSLEPSVDDLLKRMRRQTRYEVRKAEKLGITVEARPAEEIIDKFINLQQETAKRQGFVTSSPEFLIKLAETFGPDANIYTSHHHGEVLNMALIIKSGREVDYFEAASTTKAYKLPGAYALVWQAIKDAKAAGYKKFNLWGISYNNNPNNRYAGVTTFKRGFGGDDVTYVPAHDYVLNKPRYIFNWLIETARRKKRKL